MKLSKREIVLLYVLGVCLIVFIGVTFIITPMSEQISKSSANINQKEDEYRNKVYEYNKNVFLPEWIEKEQKILEGNKDSLNQFYNDTALYKFSIACFKDAGFNLSSYICSSHNNVNGIADILVTSISVETEKTFASKEEITAGIKNLLISMYGYMNSVIIDSVKYSIKGAGVNFDCSIIVNFSIYMSNG